MKSRSETAKGTTIRLFLKQTELPTDEPARAESAAEPSGHRQAGVLVIDDDPVVRRFLADSLEALNYRVDQAEDGPSGLKLLETRKPDVLVVDYAMPRMTGAEVVRIAKDRHPDPPVVFASGYSNTAAVQSAAGPDATVLRKPFLMSNLQVALNAAFAAAPSR